MKSPLAVSRASLTLALKFDLTEISCAQSFSTVQNEGANFVQFASLHFPLSFEMRGACSRKLLSFFASVLNHLSMRLYKTAARFATVVPLLYASRRIRDGFLATPQQISDLGTCLSRKFAHFLTRLVHDFPL